MLLGQLLVFVVEPCCPAHIALHTVLFVLVIQSKWMNEFLNEWMLVIVVIACIKYHMTPITWQLHHQSDTASADHRLVYYVDSHQQCQTSSDASQSNITSAFAHQSRKNWTSQTDILKPSNGYSPKNSANIRLALKNGAAASWSGKWIYPHQVNTRSYSALNVDEGPRAICVTVQSAISNHVYGYKLHIVHKMELCLR